MPRLDFVPERDGFHLGNSSGNQIMPGTPLTFTAQTRSRCHEAHNPNRHLCAGATSLRPTLAGRRPRAALGHINEPMAAALIYPAVMAAWAYLAAYHAARQAGPVLAAVVFVTGFAATFEYNRQLGKDARKQAVEILHRSQGGELPEGEGA